MDDLIKELVDRAGLSEEQAKAAAEVVVEWVKDEDKRKKISHDLQDEIAQTLLGINVRLLTLKKEAGLNAEGLQKEIASTRRLVDKSVAGIKRFAREYRKHHET